MSMRDSVDYVDDRGRRSGGRSDDDVDVQASARTGGEGGELPVLATSSRAAVSRSQPRNEDSESVLDRHADDTRSCGLLYVRAYVSCGRARRISLSNNTSSLAIRLRKKLQAMDDES